MPFLKQDVTVKLVYLWVFSYLATINLAATLQSEVAIADNSIQLTGKAIVNKTDTGILEREDSANGAEQLLVKRQANQKWNMDYGWGGGRFGKRAGQQQKAGWNMDYGWGGGRFGKRPSWEMDYGWGGGRFGKRQQRAAGNDLAARKGRVAAWELDYGWGGGRFGKRATN